MRVSEGPILLPHRSLAAARDDTICAEATGLKVRHLAVELPVAVAGRFGAGRAADLLDLLGLFGLYGIIQQLTQRAGLPMPRVCLIDEDQPNAFATGRNPEHAAVAVNTGLLRHLSREEVTGVLAHELGHVKNRDTLTMTVAATLSG